jgi:surfactin synthase thioesterase subunit
MKRNTYNIPYSIFVNGDEYPHQMKITDFDAESAKKQLEKLLRLNGNENHHIGDPIIVK